MDDLRWWLGFYLTLLLFGWPIVGAGLMVLEIEVKRALRRAHRRECYLRRPSLHRPRDGICQVSRGPLGRKGED